MQDKHCHTSSILVKVPADRAFRIMSDGIAQGAWAWGSFDREEVSPGVFAGNSVFTGDRTFVRLLPDPERLLVDYQVAASESGLRFRNMSRVLPGPTLGYDEDYCVVSLLTWRLADQTDEAWEQIGCVHEAEMFLIRGLLERGAA